MVPKLVRDRIPEFIYQTGETPIYHKADPDDLRDWLVLKLQEEVDEYKVSGEANELVDIVEVCYALYVLKNGPSDDLTTLRINKLVARGGFERGYILRDVEEGAG